MSRVEWFPETPRERLRFFLQSFPIFIVLVVFLYFGLDWLGAFEFLEHLVQQNSSWLMHTIFRVPYDKFDLIMSNRREYDPLLPGQDTLLIWPTPLYPGLMIDGYSNPLIIIRACTGMEAGALLAALILVTPAKWEKKVIAQVTNFLMMHIGNTFRVAFHFWFTNYLHEEVGLSEADAFLYAHDYLSKVFGFIGIIIFTLVIERIGVKIVSTFGAWLDAFGEGIKRAYWKIRDSSYYLSPISAAVVAENPNNEFIDKKLEVDDNTPTKVTDSKVAIKVEHSEKMFFYPLEEIKNEKWSKFLRTFGTFIAISGVLLIFGLIPGFSKMIAQASDYIASSWFGAEFTGLSKVNAFWYTSLYNGTTYNLTISIFRSGLGIAAFIIGLIIATPATWRNRITAILITIIVVLPMNIFRLGIQKWAIWSLANNNALKTTKTTLYINLASLVTDWIPVIYFVIVFSLLIYICHKLEVKVLSSIFAWIHQIYYWGAGRLGIRDEPEEESKEKPAL